MGPGFGSAMSSKGEQTKTQVGAGPGSGRPSNRQFSKEIDRFCLKWPETLLISKNPFIVRIEA